MIKKNLAIVICLSLLTSIVLSSLVLRYCRLDSIPYGFHVDELSGSVEIGCMATEGVDAHNVPHPMFSIVGYGTPKPPTYIYPAILWAKIFGFSDPSLRAFSVTVHLLGLIGLFLLARSWLGWRYALVTLTVASISPWTWNISRVAFESLFSLTFMIWGMVFFFKTSKIWSIVLSALLFAAAMYSYPPIRVQLPLMLVTLFIYKNNKASWTGRSWSIFLMTLIIAIIPLAQKTIGGEIQSRFNAISIFSKDYLNAIHSPGHLIDIVSIFINNYLISIR